MRLFLFLRKGGVMPFTGKVSDHLGSSDCKPKHCSQVTTSLYQKTFKRITSTRAINYLRFYSLKGVFTLAYTDSNPQHCLSVSLGLGLCECSRTCIIVELVSLCFYMCLLTRERGYPSLWSQVPSQPVVQCPFWGVTLVPCPFWRVQPMVP